MNTNTVEVAVTITVNGQTYTAAASGNTDGNPFRLADSMAGGVAAEACKKLADPRYEWDAARRPIRRGGL
ncbi:hypothetical protein ABZ949_02030 [Micromonospora tulbaghiae]|uniref:hypothetical protein n=1 Tax=Micromonospora tulbaghiae TaxID=479978 RepID=UPI0033C7CFB0